MSEAESEYMLKTSQMIQQLQANSDYITDTADKSTGGSPPPIVEAALIVSCAIHTCTMAMLDHASLTAKYNRQRIR